MSSQPQIVSQLIAEASGGDKVAMNSLLREIRPFLLNYIRDSVLRGNESLVQAEDATQAAQLEIAQGMPDFRNAGSAAFYAWARKVASTRTFNLIRTALAKKRGGGRAADPDAFSPSTARQLTGRDPTSSRIVRRREAIHELNAAISLFDHERREIIALRYVEQLSPQQIAERVGKEPGAVRMILLRALSDLKRRLSSNFGETSLGI